MVGSEGLDGNHVPYSLLYTPALLPKMLGPRAQALSYHLPTKYILPNSQAQSLEIPFVLTEFFSFTLLGMNTRDFKYKWGGEDWDLLDRVLMLPIEVERIKHPGLFHHFHAKRMQWN